MVANNAKYKTEIKLGDFDCNSLYPSAMNRSYVPTGVCKKLTPELLAYYNDSRNLFKIGEDETSPDQRTLMLLVELKKGPNFK